MNLAELDSKTLAELRKIAKERNIENTSEYSKHELILKILEAKTQDEGNIFIEGVLEIISDGAHGVLRSMRMLPGDNDVYVSGSQIKRFNLREGDYVTGQARLPKDNEKYLSLLRLEAINGRDPEQATKRVSFDRLTPIFPDKQIMLETDPNTLSTRVIDLLAPVGKGQRGMIVAPPKTGKTILLKEIANGIAVNNPQLHLLVVLIGERPEEVTDMQRFVKGEVVASNFDDQPENQVRVAELALERAKRLVEEGMDVVILMDSLTRLARAYNMVLPTSGRTLSGGFDPVALYPPKKFFGAARNFEEKGSLTIIATALIDTGSRMDDLVYEEFKGTGNMELVLDRRLSERRVYPAIDASRSSTRNEEKLLPPEVLKESWRVRRMLDALKSNDKMSSDGLESFLDRLKRTKNNEEFLATLHESL
jgi:transcription termination factor Rho